MSTEKRPEANRYDGPPEHYAAPSMHAEPEHPEPDVWVAAFSRCGWNGNGECLLSGTEHCDFHCPLDATARAESD